MVLYIHLACGTSFSEEMGCCLTWFTDGLAGTGGRVTQCHGVWLMGPQSQRCGIWGRSILLSWLCVCLEGCLVW